MWQKFISAFAMGSLHRHLPARVQIAIQRQQESSEIVISVIQLAVVTAFVTLYTISPKTFPPEVEFKPVPWVLGAYLAFTLLRLTIAMRGRLPGWFVSLSIVADMVLLMLTIWSFHIQYMQPAAFYLKAPTLLYVFIFIALRALRYEAHFILLAGGAAALGWLSMVLYVVMAVPGDTMITRDYVAYLTSNSILLGAEFDKVISIVLVTAILAMAVARARALLVQSVTETTAVRELSRFFSPEIAHRITDSDIEITAGKGVERVAAVLNVDLRGFTIFSGEVGPNELIAVLSEYQSRIVPAIQRHGGCVDKFLGDGIMATFGAAVVSETFAADALSAVDDVLVEAMKWSSERRAAGKPAMEVNVAVATGQVVFGAVGDASRLEYTVIGTPANLSAKLEKHNKFEKSIALTTAETLALAEKQGYRPLASVERRNGARIAGVDEPIDLVAWLPNQTDDKQPPVVRSINPITTPDRVPS